MKLRHAAALAALTAAAVSAPAAAQGPTEPPLVLALVVTNNHSAELGRPELQYADDDGAKYYALFRMVAGQDDVVLLTDFDQDSSRLFPDAVSVAKPPSRANVMAAAARLGARAKQATAAGRRVDFYFVFAGHGDVDHGRGFLEVRDGRLDSADVEGLVKALPATRAHVILDSCNSFFVLNPRSPGGRRVGITEAAARSLSDRLPNVGVLLSTSAEAEVFEWSELQSGIFSHAVRSGLLGGADVDGDGRITYDEIRAFVDVASASVANPLFRPKVFARGPNGRGDEPIFDLATARALRVEVDGREQRLTVRDEHELPWIDLHKEPDAKLTLRIPETMAKGASVDERDLLAPGGPVIARRAVAAPDPEATMHLASLEPSAPEARGPNELLGQLFASPFGPHAFAGWRERASQAEEPVYGVSSEDTERMRLLLEQVADMQRQQRVASGMMLLGIGAGLGAGGAWIATDKSLPLTNAGALSGTLFVEGGLFALTGIVDVAIRRDGERLYEDYVRAMAAPGVDSAQVVARTEQRIFDMADASRRQRAWIAPVGWAFLLGAGALFAGDLAFNRDPSTRLEYGVTSGIFAFVGLTAAVAASIQTPIERMVDLWSHDPSTLRMPRVAPPSVSLSPLPGGGAFLDVHGAF